MSKQLDSLTTDKLQLQIIENESKDGTIDKHMRIKELKQAVGGSLHPIDFNYLRESPLVGLHSLASAKDPKIV